MTTTSVASVRTVADVSVVAQGDDFVVGDAATGTFVVLPAIGVDVLTWLRDGHDLDRIAALARDRAGEAVDVAGFVEALEGLGFVTHTPADRPAPTAPTTAGRAARSADRIASAVCGRIGFAAVAGLGAFCVAVFAVRTDLLPTGADLFFLSTPARSLAALTVITYLLALAHEGAHWLSARRAGVRAPITVSRRLYFLAFETDLTGLWSIPRRRRWAPIAAGMAFDVAVLGVLLLVRVTGNPDAGSSGARLLAALTLVEVAAVVAQFLFFLRTDVYALLVVATGTLDLYRTTQLSLLSLVRLATRRQREELVHAEPGDLRVARWYRWVWLVGMGFAAFFFVRTFVPAVVDTGRWVAGSVWPPHVSQGSFWEAIVLAALVVSPEALTLGVAVRDLRRRCDRARDRRRAGAHCEA